MLMPNPLLGPAGRAGVGRRRLGAMSGRDLVGLQGVSPDGIRALLACARDAGDLPPDALSGRTVANLFFEDSTRTRVSFTIAAQKLGAMVVDLGGKGSSVSKGETLLDTARTVAAMGVDALVVRARENGAASMMADAVGAPVLNAGDGVREHPTQALLDALTLAEATGRADSFDFTGLRVAIVGDVLSSRVAGSNVACLTALGAEIVLVGPPRMAPVSMEKTGVTVSHDLDDVLPGVDAVMALRIQFERHEGTNIAIDSAEEYRETYGLTSARVARMKDGASVMHPGPMNRGLEIDDDVADGPRSLVLAQVANGVRTRMGALKWCIDWSDGGNA